MKRILVPVLVGLLLVSLAVSGAAAQHVDPLQWEQQTENNSSESLFQNQNRHCLKWCPVLTPADQEQLQQRLRDGSCLDPELLERMEGGEPVRQQLRDGSCYNELGGKKPAGGRGQGQLKRLRDGSCL